MKKIMLLFICISLPLFSTAQHSPKQREVGLIFSGLENFGLTYRTGTSEKLWRFQTVFLGGGGRDNSSDDIIDKQNDLGAGLAIGREYRKQLMDKLEFRYGLDLKFNYSHVNSERQYGSGSTLDYRSTKLNLYRPGVDLVFGLNYTISENLVIGAEVLPGFNYSIGESKTTSINGTVKDSSTSTVSSFNYGFTNRSILLSLVYRFIK